MKKELTEVYCGSAKGKTTLALGHSLRAAAEGKSVIIIQFLKGKETRSVDFLEQLDDLDIKIFRFEKRDCCYDDLSDEEKAEIKARCPDDDVAAFNAMWAARERKQMAGKK